MTCGPSTPPRRSCAVFFHQGAPRLGEDALRTEPGLATLRAAAAAHLSAAGQRQVATAPDMLAATEAQLGPLRAGGTPDQTSCRRGSTPAPRAPR